jgi:hypothetical protein
MQAEACTPERIQGACLVSDVDLPSAPLGVCVLPKPGINRAQPVNYPNYIFEILDHAGVC